MIQIPKSILSRMSASVSGAASHFNAFVSQENTEAVSLLLAGELPSDEMQIISSELLAIPLKDYKAICSELWRATVASQNPLLVNIDSPGCLLLAEQHLQRNRRSVSDYFLVGRSVHYWRDSMIGDFLTSSNDLYYSIINFLFQRGCRVFASYPAVCHAIVSEQWPGWQVWQEESK